MPRGRLRVYLGVAPGAGTTHALLDEARRRVAGGGDVVIATIGTRRRPGLDQASTGLERVGDGTAVEVEELLARRPTTVVVDDLHEAGSARHDHRWEDVEELLDAGIDVITALDVRRIASLADVVASITGSRPIGVVPDRVLAEADQLQLVDIDPHTLRRRLAHGGLCPAEELDAETAATLQPAALCALRELALLWTAGAVAVRRTVDHGAPVAQVRERLIVGLSGGPETEPLLHRAARLAARIPGAELHAVHVLTGQRPVVGVEPDANRLRDLAVSVGATYQQVIGTDVAAALLAVAEAEHGTQVLVGADQPVAPAARTPQRGGPPGRTAARAWGTVVAGGRRLRRGPGTAARLVTLAAGPAEGLDVHVVCTASGSGSGAMPRSRPGLPRWRQVGGFVLSGALPALLTVGLRTADPWVGLPGVSLLFLLAVVVTALVGGLVPAIISAVVGSTLLNYWFIPPVRTFRVAEPHNVITLIVFVLVAVLVSAVVHRAATLATRAARASAEARALAVMAGAVLRGDEALPTLLEHVRSAFGMTSAALLERAGGSWHLLHARGPLPPRTPAEADVTVRAGENLVLGLSGRTLAATDRALLRAFAAQAEGLLERDRLARAAAVAARLEATERLRDALLAAVGHDLRTPLASATAAVSSLRAGDIAWSAAEGQELLATAEESLQRLARLVADLLDLSRLRAGVLTVTPSVVWLDEVIPPALDELGDPARAVDLRIAEDAPPVLADPALLTRVLVNVLANALRHSPAGVPPAVTASAGGDRVQVRVIDHGPGVPSQDRERIFTPFQRLGDTDNGVGLGLGLALSRGLAEAMDGVLEPEDTPGGGLTMVLDLPAAAEPAEARPDALELTEGPE
ncbi:MAG TPA: DUF4118 domain-containing protein [Kineosporiaceae bacterium]